MTPDNAAVVANVGIAQAVPLASTAPTATQGFFVGQKIVIDTGANEETVTLTAINTAAGTVTGIFTVNHAAGTPVTEQGGFSAGVVPTTAFMVNGSTGNVLKVFGDINGDGRMVYVEYLCDLAGGNLYRNSMAFDAVAKQPPNVSQILLNNIQPNPGGHRASRINTGR